MSPEQKPPSSRTKNAGDLLAALGLAAKATSGVATIAEGLHQAIYQNLGLGRKGRRKDGISDFVYHVVRRVSGFVEQGARLGHHHVSDLSQLGPSRSLKSLAILNGVVGDSLVEANHALALPMSFQSVEKQKTGGALEPLETSPDKLVLFIHGLCLSDQSWFDAEPTYSSPHACALETQCGWKSIFLRYNTGLHISQNGQTLARALDELLRRFSSVKELAIIAHSMGGLVARSACHYGEKYRSGWRKKLTRLVFLGTPHHGAPLARLGNLVDHLLTLNRFSEPFLKLTRVRSAGIQDLRFGNLVDEDWQAPDVTERLFDPRGTHQLPADVACFTMAATKSPEPLNTQDTLLGDGLVPVASALGRHAQGERMLRFSPGSQRIFANMNHNALLKSARVSNQLCQWLK